MLIETSQLHNRLSGGVNNMPCFQTFIMSSTFLSLSNIQKFQICLAYSIPLSHGLFNYFQMTGNDNNRMIIVLYYATVIYNEFDNALDVTLLLLVVNNSNSLTSIIQWFLNDIDDNHLKIEDDIMNG